MTKVTIEGLKQQHEELGQKIEQFIKDNATKAFVTPAVHLELKAGEHYAGIVLKDDGTPSHHLVLLPGDEGDLNFDKASAWATERGGFLPTRQEQSLLFANLKGQFEAAWYWSGQQHETNASFAWIQTFDDGYQYGSRKDFEFRARAVRRLVIE